MFSDSGFVSWTRAGRLDPGRLDPRFYGPEHLALLDKLDSAEGTVVPLGQLVSHLAHVTGYESTKHMDWVNDDSGVRVVEAQNIGDGLLAESDWKRISAGGYSNLARHHLEVDDVVFSKDGTLGSVALVGPRFLPAVASRHVFRMHPKRNVDGGFLAAWLLSSAGQIQTQHRQAGAVQGTIITPEVAAFRVLKPDPDIQRAIGNKLRKAERLRELAAWARDRANRVIDDLMHFGVARQPFPNHGWRPKGKVDQDRLDAWFHRPEYVWRAEALGKQPGLRQVRSLCRSITKAADFTQWSRATFDYFEIGGIDATTGEALSKAVPLSEAPSRAKYLVQAGDLLVSTVRPNLKKVGQVDPDRVGVGIATSGFSVWRASAPEIGAYLRACLMHQVGVEQMMRWNTGGTYPAIDTDVPGRVLVPFEEEQASAVGQDLLGALANVRQAGALITAAKASVEALIEGTFDEAAHLTESNAIEQWLAENPSPSQRA